MLDPSSTDPYTSTEREREREREREMFEVISKPDKRGGGTNSEKEGPPFLKREERVGHVGG